MGASFKHFRFVMRIKSSHHICSDDIWLFPRSLENLQWCWFTTTQWGHLKSTAQSCQQTNKQTNNAETSTICQWKTQGGKRAATATCSDISLTWWQTRFRWVAPRELVLTNFFLLLIIFWVIIVLLSCRLAEAVVFLKAGGGGNLRFDSF